MPYTEHGSPYAPGPHGEPSHAAAQHADRSREHRGRMLLKLLYARGPLTDHACAAALGCPLSAINSTRNAAMVYELIERGTDKQRTEYGQMAWTWRLTHAGKAAVVAMLPAAIAHPKPSGDEVQGHDLNAWGLR